MGARALSQSLLLFTLLSGALGHDLDTDVPGQPFTIPPLPPIDTPAPTIDLSFTNPPPPVRTRPTQTPAPPTRTPGTRPPGTQTPGTRPPGTQTPGTRPPATQPQIPVIMLTKKTLQGVLGNAVLRSTSGVRGTVNFVDDGTLLHVSGVLHNVGPGQHGLVVHDWGNITANCDEIGDHFNPDWFMHGPIDSPLRHNGDLGNVEEGEPFSFTTDAMRLVGGRKSVLGRAIALHRNEDDFGQLETVDSKKYGSVGPAFACAIIARTDVIYA